MLILKQATVTFWLLIFASKHIFAFGFDLVDSLFQFRLQEKHESPKGGPRPRSQAALPLFCTVRQSHLHLQGENKLTHSKLFSFFDTSMLPSNNHSGCSLKASCKCNWLQQSLLPCRRIRPRPETAFYPYRTHPENFPAYLTSLWVSVLNFSGLLWGREGGHSGSQNDGLVWLTMVWFGHLRLVWVSPAATEPLVRRFEMTCSAITRDKSVTNVLWLLTFQLVKTVCIVI